LITQSSRYGWGQEAVETTRIRLHAGLRQKDDALAKIAPLDVPPGRFRLDDELLALL
jgi:integrase/recombinase XerD